MEKFEININKTQKLNDALIKYGLKYSQIMLLYKNKDIKIDGKRVSCNQDVFEGQVVTFFMLDKSLSNNSKRFEVIFEDDNILILNKPSGIEVTGENGMVAYLENCIAVHRLDKDTKGLIVFAKNKEAEIELLQAFKQQDIQKKYICEVLGDTNFKNLLDKAYLFKDSKNAFVTVFSNKVSNSVEIKTIFNTLKHGRETSVIEAELLTGKTHQIRAHLKYLGHPILGDSKYGNKELNKKFKENKQKLFCYFLKFKRFENKLKYLEGKEFLLCPDWAKNIMGLKENNE